MIVKHCNVILWGNSDFLRDSLTRCIFNVQIICTKKPKHLSNSSEHHIFVIKCPFNSLDQSHVFHTFAPQTSIKHISIFHNDNNSLQDLRETVTCCFKSTTSWLLHLDEVLASGKVPLTVPSDILKYVQNWPSYSFSEEGKVSLSLF